MKIVYLINHKGETGLNNVVLDLTTLFSSHGHNCTIFYLKDTEKEIEFPCKTIKIDEEHPLVFKDYDIVHTHGIHPNLYVLRHKPWGKSKTKFVATLHCYVFQDFMDLFGKVKGFLYSFLFLLSIVRHDLLITLSQDAQRYYQQLLPWKKSAYAYNTRTLDDTADLTLEEKRELSDFKNDGVLIGMNGVLIRRKGIDVMLKALELLPKDYKVMFIGGDTDSISKWKKQVKADIQDRVYFAGSHPKAYRYLPYYDIYVLPSRSEGFPLAMVEAAAKGCKIACSALPQLKEIFTEGEVAWCKIGDAESLAAAIIKARSLDGSKAKNTFEKKLSPDSFYKRHLDIYDCLH